MAGRPAHVSVGVSGVERQHRRTRQTALNVAGGMVTEHVAVDTPVFLRHADPSQQRKRVTTAREPRARDPELLSTELQYATVVESLTVKSAVEIGVLVAGGDIDAGVRVGVVDAPAAHVDPQLARASLDAQMLERPELHRRQIEHSAGAGIEIVDLESIVEDSDAAEIAIVQSSLWSRQPPRSERRHSWNAVEEVHK